MKYKSALIPLFAFLLPLFVTQGAASAADMKDFETGWIGEIPDTRVFQFQLHLALTDSSHGSLRLSGGIAPTERIFQLKPDRTFAVSFDSALSFLGVLDRAAGTVRGFLHSGVCLYHLTLQSNGSNSYHGEWNPLLLDRPNGEFFLDIENGSGDKYEAYAFFADNRIPSMMDRDFTKRHDSLFFQEGRTGMAFRAALTRDTIWLEFRLLNQTLTRFPLHRQQDRWNSKLNYPKPRFTAKPPAKLDDGLEVSSLDAAGSRTEVLAAMMDSINSGAFPNTHAVLISRHGKLAFEQYFDGFSQNLPHDTRSASKSLSSAVVGIALDRRLLSSTDQKLFDLIPGRYRDAALSVPRKSRIRILDLLTMSSGLDAIDFGVDRTTPASEDVYQSTSDWPRTILDAPMLSEPGTHANYSSANPYLLGVILDSVAPGPLELFMDHYLLAPLGISNYLIQTDCFGRPYFGGGIYLTPRDMLKFGLLYLNGGIWKGNELISSQWVRQSFGNYHTLENTTEKNGYGYLWWHYRYNVGGNDIQSIEARGAGGQYIFIVPDYELVAVITSGNYRGGKTSQPEKIFEQFILPSLIKN